MLERERQLDREDKYTVVTRDRNSTYSKVERGFVRKVIKENQ